MDVERDLAGTCHLQSTIDQEPNSVARLSSAPRRIGCRSGWQDASASAPVEASAVNSNTDPRKFIGQHLTRYRHTASRHRGPPRAGVRCPRPITYRSYRGMAFIALKVVAYPQRVVSVVHRHAKRPDAAGPLRRTMLSPTVWGRSIPGRHSGSLLTGARILVGGSSRIWIPRHSRSSTRSCPPLPPVYIGTLGLLSGCALRGEELLLTCLVQADESHRALAAGRSGRPPRTPGAGCGPSTHRARRRSNPSPRRDG